ncbi:TIM barrel protein [Candidatus Chlorohelix sp.]|uniref:sugar phosphate isomerase/epimerase family protein n=1 Tax=Candidatus Chlorohelix sp. TaxID=3139201 RepID=UPI00305E9B3A
MSFEPELDFGFLTQNQKPKPLFSYSTSLNLSQDDPTTLFESLKKAGITGIDLASAWGKELYELTNEDLKQLEKILKQTELAISRVNSQIGTIGIGDAFESEKLKFERMLEVADWFGASYIKVSSFKGDGTNPEQLAEAIKRLSELAEQAQPWGIIMLHENAPGYIGDKAARCKHIIYEVASSNLRTSFNPAQFMEVGEKPLSEAYEPMLAQYTYVQLENSLFQSPETLEQSELKKLLATMWENGYQGYINLDTREDGAFQLNSFESKLATLKGIVKAVSSSESV